VRSVKTSVLNGGEGDYAPIVIMKMAEIIINVAVFKKRLHGLLRGFTRKLNILNMRLERIFPSAARR